MFSLFAMGDLLDGSWEKLSFYAVYKKPMRLPRYKGTLNYVLLTGRGPIFKICRTMLTSSSLSRTMFSCCYTVHLVRKKKTFLLLQVIIAQLPATIPRLQLPREARRSILMSHEEGSNTNLCPTPEPGIFCNYQKNRRNV